MVQFEPHRFRSTIPFYERYRIPYPEALITAVAGSCAIGPGSMVLDLGCGPGQLAIAFARLGATATAMDPDPAMLEAARARAAEAGVALSLVEGSSYDLSPALGRFHLVSIGRAFHWMDREATLVALDGIIEPGGAIVLFGNERLETPGADWPALVKRLREEFLPEREAARRWRMIERENRSAVLARSAFSRLDRRAVIVSRTLTPDEIVGAIYTYSDTSSDALGDRRPAFERALREGLARLSPESDFAEVAQVTAVIATRP